jgi:acid stress-induced BolA-like protein IbaG/YrbA
MAKEAGSELVAVVRKHLSKVKQAQFSRSNMDKTLKEEAVHAVSEIVC